MKRNKAIQDAVKRAVEPNWLNKTLFLGDNLAMMRRMNSGLMDLIYLDPPFNSNRKYGKPIGDSGLIEVFKDVWRETDLDQAECARLAKDFPALYTNHPSGQSRARRLDVLLPADDGAPPDRMPPPPQRNRKPLPPLRPNRLPLPQNDTRRHLQTPKLPQRNRLVL